MPVFLPGWSLLSNALLDKAELKKEFNNDVGMIFYK
jgi:hypothetical protein